MKNTKVTIDGVDCMKSVVSIGRGQELWFDFDQPMHVRFKRISGTKFEVLQGPRKLGHPKSSIIRPDEAQLVVTDGTALKELEKVSKGINKVSHGGV